MPTSKPGSKGKKAQALTPNKAQLKEQDRQALTLRMGGATYDQIADRLGFADRSGARKAVLRATSTEDQALAEMRDEQRRESLARMDRMLTAIWAAALGDPANQVPPDEKLIAKALDIEKRRAALLGLDITRLEHSGPDGEPIEVTDARSRLATMLAGKSAARASQ